MERGAASRSDAKLVDGRLKAQQLTPAARLHQLKISSHPRQFNGNGSTRAVCDHPQPAQSLLARPPLFDAQRENRLSEMQSKLASNRPLLLNHLKDLGVEKLGERQALANASQRPRRRAAYHRSRRHAPPGAHL